MNTILIPLDGSPFAETALHPGARLANRHEASLVLTTVVSDLPPVPLTAADGEMVSQWFKEEEERAEKYMSAVRERLASTFPDLSMETHVQLGPVARTLLAQAAEVDADLISLTTHGRGAWQRAWLGSVADGVLRGAKRPVLLLRDGGGSSNLFADESSPAHVVVPLDGSSASEEILGPLTSLLPSDGGRVTLVSVVGRPFPLASTYLPHAVEEEKVSEEQKERAKVHLQEVAEEWNPLGVTVESRILVSDDIARSVLDVVDEVGADLLALSTRGRGGVGRMILGSVADKLVRGTEIPVLAVRRSSGDGQG